jgi:hypothetical protein
MFRKVGLGVLLLLSSTAQAEQVIQAYENKVLTARVGAQTLNRIFVEDDRIHAVRGLDGEYTLNQDTDAGEIYVRPMTSHVIQLFLSTVKGKHYQLQLKPTAQHAETLHLTPVKLTKKELLMIAIEESLPPQRATLFDKRSP